VSGTLQRAYDASFRLASRSLNGTVISQTLDADDLLVAEGALTLVRDPQHGLTRSTTLGNVATVVTRNAFGEVIAMTATAGGVELYATSYTRDDLGRVIGIEERIGGATLTYEYRYDLAGRLIEALRAGGGVADFSEQYEYDANGNRTHAAVGDGVTGIVSLTGSYDEQDRLLTYGDATFAHTDAGDRLTRTADGQTTTYAYDALGNLVGVTLASGDQIAYLIDGRNRRVGKQLNGALVQGFIYQDQLRPIAELDGGGAIRSRFVYADGLNVPAYMVRGGTTYRILTDLRGSVRLVIDTATGEIAQRLDYDSFGVVLQDTNPSFQPFGFAGGLYDRDTGLVRFGARDYDPLTGRWTAKDPIVFAGLSTNLYQYVLNDPINLDDPSGLSFLSNVQHSFVQTNNSIPGLVAPAGLTLLTGGTVGNAIGTMSLLQAVSFVRASWGVGWVGTYAVDVGLSVAATGLANFLLTGGAFEVGVGIGSLLDALLTEALGKSLGEWLYDFLHPEEKLGCR
jgi:RHS repeat-associated protein